MKCWLVTISTRTWRLCSSRLFRLLRWRSKIILQLNWLWVQLIVTLPITGTMPWYPPRDTQSRGPSLLLTSVHVEQYRKCASAHVSYLFLNSGCKTTIFSWFCRYARYSSLRNLIPPKFAFSLKLRFPIIPCFAFYLQSFCVNSPNSVFCYSLFS